MGKAVVDVVIGFMGGHLFLKPGFLCGLAITIYMVGEIKMNVVEVMNGHLQDEFDTGGCGLCLRGETLG